MDLTEQEIKEFENNVHSVWEGKLGANVTVPGSIKASQRGGCGHSFAMSLMLDSRQLIQTLRLR